MPSTTAKGFRQPLDDDPFGDGALAVRNLAADVDTKIGVAAAGTAVVALAAVSTDVVVVNFPAGRFTVAPIVVASVGSNSAAYFAQVYGITTTQATVRVSHRDGTAATTNITVNWIALQQ